MPFEPLDTIELTAEEQHAASAFIRSLTPPGEQMVVREETAEELKRGLVALGMFSLADRLTVAGRGSGNTALVERGCVAAVKAFSLYPIAVNCYECARVLAFSGRSADARVMFQEFLGLSETEPAGAVRDHFTGQHDVPELRGAAQLFLSHGVVVAT